VASMPIPPDKRFRDRISSELDRTLLVEAGAGTGKTTCLVSRMVALLREGKCQVETIAAVTFTRKAAAELRTRFQLAIESAARNASDIQRHRLVEASGNVERCFIGTIHSFCARLLRERPVEAGVDPGFVELDENIDDVLRQKAWREHVAGLIANNDRVLPELEGLGLKITPATRRSRTIASELDELGLEPAELGPAFLRFAEFSDVDDWPTEKVPLPDLRPCIAALNDYVAFMRGVPLPLDHGRDKLMPKYDLIGRMTRRLDLSITANLMEVLEHFQELERGDVIQKNWPSGKLQALGELERWNQFVYTYADPILLAWREHRYETVMLAIRPATLVYDRLRQERNGLNYQDLLLRSVQLLRDKPDVRRYFRERFTHLLVDEFQDTDPLQAEVMLLLTADDFGEQDWQRCRPVAGSLFVVGDPKQSIYRFRRADIVTYNKVRSIIEQVGGDVIPLTGNFRSVKHLIEWVNVCFSRIFPPIADDYNPADRPLQPGRLDGRDTGHSATMPAKKDADDLSFELQVDEPEVRQVADLSSESGFNRSAVESLVIPAQLKKFEDISDYEADLIARTIRHAIDEKWPVLRTDGERSRGLPNHAVAGDFLIVARTRARLAIYARKLQQYDVPHSVTGGSVLNQVPELELLYVCLAAVVRCDDPIALVAALRSELFGVADTALYDFFRMGGRGRFSYRTDVPEGMNEADAANLKDAFGRMQRFSRWLNRMPTAAAIERIAADLGLFARAAAGEEGDAQAGSLLKAIELLRAADNTMTAGDFVDALSRLVEADESIDGIPVRPPAEMPVRVMNLHQCKGLEAPIVFLVDPSGEWEHDVDVHIDRSCSKSRGYLPVYGRRRGEWSPPPLLAQPKDWRTLAEREQQFLDAEAMRLLYVAATRAGVNLIISQREEKNERNPWKLFVRDLQDLPTRTDPGPVPVRPIVPVAFDTEKWHSEVDAIERRWQSIAKPTYQLTAIKESAIKGKLKPHGAEKAGAEWGEVLHTLLEAAMKDPSVDLQALALSALEQQELSAALLDDVIATVYGVIGSEIWKRAQKADHCLTEVPIAMPVPAAESETGLPTVVRGVIDLAFKEKAGWVIVDYKSERVDASSIPELVAYYRPQIEAYVEVWKKIVGEPIVESGLLFTHTGAYVAI
jgi:ATP-dependent helicase/nuclease subunit A